VSATAAALAQDILWQSEEHANSSGLSQDGSACLNKQTHLDNSIVGEDLVLYKFVQDEIHLYNAVVLSPMGGTGTAESIALCVLVRIAFISAAAATMSW